MNSPGFFTKGGNHVRLEVPLRSSGRNRSHIDIVIIKSDRAVLGIELKYKTKKDKFVADNEVFELRDHAAVPLGRYDFWNDVRTLEHFKKLKAISSGFAVFLTNDSAYWNKAKESGICAQFSMDEKRPASRRLAWTRPPKQSSVGIERMDAIQLDRQYSLHWEGYAVLKSTKLRFLAVAV
ncbi:MAG: hypothetical protein ACLP05_05150 [Candidatus Kryptoniota bacterium]